MRVPADEVAFDTANFVATTPHHHGATDMTQAELRYGHDGTLRRIAQEIVAMRLAHAPAGIGRR